MYRKSKPVKDQKLPEHNGDINDEKVVTTVVDENQGGTPQPIDIEIGERKKDEKQVQQHEKKDQVASACNQAENNNNNNNNINKEGEGI